MGFGVWMWPLMKMAGACGKIMPHRTWRCCVVCVSTCCVRRHPIKEVSRRAGSEPAGIMTICSVFCARLNPNAFALGHLLATPPERRRSGSRLFYSLSPQLLIHFEPTQPAKKAHHDRANHPAKMSQSISQSRFGKAETTKETFRQNRMLTLLSKPDTFDQHVTRGKRLRMLHILTLPCSTLPCSNSREAASHKSCSSRHGGCSICGRLSRQAPALLWREHFGNSAFAQSTAAGSGADGNRSLWTRASGAVGGGVLRERYRLHPTAWSLAASLSLHAARPALRALQTNR